MRVLRWVGSGLALLVVGAVVAAACSGGGDGSGSREGGERADRREQSEEVGQADQSEAAAAGIDATTEVVETVQEAESVAETGARVLASGVWELPGAEDFGAAGFHDVLEAVATLPDDLGPTAGRRLVLALTDVSRPGVACGSEHPLSGCATVDWSDFEGRPGVPESGVFENRVSLGTVAGEQTLYLSESGALAKGPDGFAPG